MNTNWTVLKCLNLPRQSFRYKGSGDINPKVSPGSTEIMKMGLFLEGGLKNSQLLLLVRPPYYAAVEILYCSYFSSAWMTSTQKYLQSPFLWRLRVLSTLHLEQIKGCNLYTSYVYQCKSIRHKSMLADCYQQRLNDVKKYLDLPFKGFAFSISFNCFF